MGNVPGTISAIFSGSQLVVIAYMALRFLPLLKARQNDARKIELDADADLRGDLMGHIKELQTQQREDRLAFAEAMAAERKRCDEELRGVRDQLAEATRRIAQLEGYDEGQGRARQEAAGIVAKERLRDRGVGK